MKTKVLVIGLDCATFTLIKPFLQEGKLPNIRRIMSEGVARILESTVPPISPPAWATFLTGKNPARHGIFHFFDLDVRNYAFTANRLVNSSFFSGQTFIDFISNQGCRVGIVKIPFTYPPWQVNGFMIAGDPSPDWQKAHTWPPELSEQIGRVNLGSHLDFERYDTLKLLEHLKYDCNARTRIACTMLEKEPYDFFMLVHNITDAAAHRFWKYTDPTCPNYTPAFNKHKDIIKEVYSDADTSIGRILEFIDKDTTIFFMSDHGAARKPLYCFHLNAWLRDKGYLACHEKPTSAQYLYVLLRKIKYLLPVGLRHLIASTIRNVFLKKASSLQQRAANLDYARTTAYAVTLHTGYDGIAINCKGRQEHGIMTPGHQTDKLCDELEKQLIEITDPRTGQKIVHKVYRRDEVFTGQFAERMPELIIHYHPDYRGGKNTTLPLVTNVASADFDFQSGDHDEHGIFMAVGPFIKRGVELPKAMIQDVAPTILYAMGLPVPDDMDGQVLVDIFEQEFINAHALNRVSSQSSMPGGSHELDEEEAAKMKQQLQGLGYF